MLFINNDIKTRSLSLLLIAGAICSANASAAGSGTVDIDGELYRFNADTCMAANGMYPFIARGKGISPEGVPTYIMIEADSACSENIHVIVNVGAEKMHAKRSSDYPSYRARLGKIVDRNDKIVDSNLTCSLDGASIVGDGLVEGVLDGRSVALPINFEANCELMTAADSAASQADTQPSIVERKAGAQADRQKRRVNNKVDRSVNRATDEAVDKVLNRIFGF